VRERSVALKPGEALAVEKMNRAMHICAELVDFYRPVIDKNGRLIEGIRKTEKFDSNRFMRAMRELRKWAVALAPFQSPRLCAVKVAPPPAAKTKTVFTVNVFDENGVHVSTSTDGKKTEIQENQTNINHTKLN